MDEVIAYVNIVTAVITVASAIANLTPTDVDNQAVAWFGRLVNAVALNWRKP